MNLTVQRSCMRKQPKRRGASAKRRALLSWLARNRAVYVAHKECVVNRMRPAPFEPLWATECHEIVGGRHRQTTERDERFWLRVHRSNHDELQHMPKAKQWALKVLFDPENFDVAALSELPGSVCDPAEVLKCVADIRKAAGVA